MVKRMRILVVLMSTSIVLLMLGIGRWIQSEYRGGMLELHKSILDDFIDARTQFTDTILARNVLLPFLEDSAGFKIQTIDQQIYATNSDSVTIIANAISTDHIMHFEGCDTCPPPEFALKHVADDSMDVLLRGMKIFITEMRGPGGEKDMIRNFIQLSDTALLQEYFRMNLDSSNIQVGIHWQSDTLPPTFPPPLFTYEARIFDDPYYAKVSGQDRYMIKQLMPLLLFAGLLISVVIAAFVLAYRSLRKHMQLAQLKDDLISNITHELKTPVATVKVALEAMQGMDPETKRDTFHKYIRMADQEVNRLDGLVNKVMQSVIGDKQSFYQQNLIDLAGLCRSTVEEMQAMAEEKQAILRIEDSKSKMFIIGDAFHLHAAIYNLIDNAIKYGGAQPRVHISMEQDAHYVRVFISDNGSGIPDMYRKKVFDKFFRVPTGNTHTIKGYGLGLHYVKQVVEACQGSIEVHNNQDAGCTFTIQIPRADA